MITNYTNFIPVKGIYKKELFDLNDLFKNPLIHREINGDKIYKPLDTKRLWG